MHMEVICDTVQLPIETVQEDDNSFLHDNKDEIINQGSDFIEPIKSGSHGIAENLSTHGDGKLDSNLPRDATDEWPEPKMIHTFFFVKHRPYDDPKLKSKFDLADKDIQKKNQTRFQITEQLKTKRIDRSEVISKLKALGAEDRQYRMAMDEKRKEMEPLQHALGQLRNSWNAGRDKGSGLCSSEEELDFLIQSLNNRMQHESISLNEEKQIIREINQLQGTREKVIANAAKRSKIQESLGPKEDIQDQVKLMGVDIDDVRKEQQIVRSKVKSLEENLKTIDTDINSLQEQLKLATEKREKAYDDMKTLRRQREEENTHFHKYRVLLNTARQLADSMDVAALRQLSDMEMDNFMSSWCGNKAFRDDYKKRLIRSLDSRELSGDGRIRNHNEKSLEALQEVPEPTQTNTIQRQIPNQPNEEEATFEKPAQKEAVTAKAASDQSEEAGRPIHKDSAALVKTHQLDEAKQKAVKREEEMAKAKAAMERKKKLADKAATRAMLLAQKAEEKRLKMCEKKLKKREAAAEGNNYNNNLSNDEEKETGGAEKMENSGVEIVEDSVPWRKKEPRETMPAVKIRRRLKGTDSHARVVIRRKKKTASYYYYLLWAAPLSIALLLLGLGCYYYYLM